MRYFLIYELKYGGYNMVVFKNLIKVKDYIHKHFLKELNIKYYVIHGTVM